MPNHGHVTGRLPDSDFEVAVAREVTRLGYEIEYQYGVAGYFIDIAVYQPGSDTRFMLAIECDGASYHSSLSARDRDKLKDEVLESRGWHVYRIWSTDWFKSRSAQVEKLARILIQDLL